MLSIIQMPAAIITAVSMASVNRAPPDTRSPRMVSRIALVVARPGSMGMIAPPMMGSMVTLGKHRVPSRVISVVKKPSTNPETSGGTRWRLSGGSTSCTSAPQINAMPKSIHPPPSIIAKLAEDSAPASVIRGSRVSEDAWIARSRFSASAADISPWAT